MLVEVLFPERVRSSCFFSETVYCTAMPRKEAAEKMKFLVRDGKFYSAFFTMTLTIALQSAIVFSVNLADAIT